ncbi:MAG: DUF2141 domain-containing protein [Bacteroidia bacterium]|nr:DUF2141 domain-containing protein [Bacteroidia bacterium]
MKLPSLIILVFAQFALSSQTLKVSITGLRNNKGSVIMGFYNNDKAFEDETPLFTKLESKASTVNHVLTLNYTGIKPGTYGIVLLDDENNNNKMDFGWILPEEGYGFSNYWHTSLTKPKVAKFSFTITNENKSVEIKVKYW